MKNDDRYVFSQGIGDESSGVHFLRLGIVGSLAGIASVSLALPMTGTGIKTVGAVIGFLVAGLWSMVPHE